MKKEIISLVAAVLIVVGLGLAVYLKVISMSDVGVAATWVVIGSIAWLIWWGWGEHIERLARGRRGPEPPLHVQITNLPTISVPVLALTPLPNHKGYPRQEPKLVELANGQCAIDFPSLPGSDPESKLLTESQIISRVLFEATVSQSQKETELIELIIKFGVIRVRCVTGNALNCKVEAKIRIIEKLGKTLNGGWFGIGYINWFSLSKKRELRSKYPSPEDLKELKFNHPEINKCFLNSVENLHENEERDLLLFYMIKDDPLLNIYSCTDTGDLIASALFDEKVKFEIELSVTAQNYPKTTFRYIVTAKWDDYQIQQVDTQKQ
jgi:hypothetical protein